MVKSLKKQYEKQTAYVKKLENEVEDMKEEMEKLEVNWEKTQSVELKRRLDSFKQVLESIKRTQQQAISQQQEIKTRETVTKQKAMEVEISVIKQKEMIKREFERQIFQAKRQCYSCDNGVAKLISNRKRLDKIKSLEEAAGGFTLSKDKPFSKKEIMDAMKTVLAKKQQRQLDREEIMRNGMQVIEQKRIERKMQRQEEKINTLRFQIQQTKNE